MYLSKIPTNSPVAEIDGSLVSQGLLCEPPERSLCFHRQQSCCGTMDQTHPDLLLCLWGKQLPAALHKYWKKNSLSVRDLSSMNGRLPRRAWRRQLLGECHMHCHFCLFCHLVLQLVCCVFHSLKTNRKKSLMWSIFLPPHPGRICLGCLVAVRLEIKLSNGSAFDYLNCRINCTFWSQPAQTVWCS